MEFKLLSNYNIEKIHSSFLAAFSDYHVPVRLSQDEFKMKIKKEGIDLNFSIGAFDGSNLIGFVLNAVDDWQGHKTCWDGGTGVIKEYRGRKVGSKMLDELIPFLEKNKVKRYLLEVIKGNESAFNLYKKKGFEITRNFDCLKVPVKDLDILNIKKIQGYQIRETEKIDFSLCETFWDVIPSWQNSCRSIQRAGTDFKILCAFNRNEIIGYGIINTASGSISQIAVPGSFRKKGIGSAVLCGLSGLAGQDKTLSIINVDEKGIDFIKFLKSKGFKSFVKQYEMMYAF